MIATSAATPKDEELAFHAAAYASMLRAAAERWRTADAGGGLDTAFSPRATRLSARLEAAARVVEGEGEGRVEEAGSVPEHHPAASDPLVERSEERFRLLVDAVKDYAIFMLDTGGHVSSWNSGAERIKGYRSAEVLGKHFSLFYPERDVARGHPQYELEIATREGRYEEEGWRVRKNGDTFWANVVITAIRDSSGRLRGFAKVTRDMTDRRAAQQNLRDLAASLEARVRDRTEQLTAMNKELEAFSYSVSHDLRAPLRALDGFSRILLGSAAERLDEKEQDYLRRIRAAAQRMSQLIDDLLDLSRLTRAPVDVGPVDLSELAGAILEELRQAEPDRTVVSVVTPGLQVQGDARLLRIALENLLGNAWKFSRGRADATIEVGCVDEVGQVVYFVRDNGAGFDLKYADKLFIPFQRLHHSRDFEGTGIGLATVSRILHRHGGRIWARSAPEQGATFFFTVGGQR